MRKQFVKKVKDKSGIAIMSVMLFFMVMMIFVGGLTIASQGNMNVAGVSADSTAAYYAAEAGINYVVSDFRRIMDFEDGDLTQTQFLAMLDSFETTHEDRRVDLSDNQGAESYFVISFKNVTSNESTGTFDFTIVSEGVVDGISRILETRVDLSYSLGAGDRKGFAVKHAILAENTIKTANNFIIGLTQNAIDNAPAGTKPSVATYSLNDGAISFSKSENFKGVVELRAEAGVNVVNVPATQQVRPLNVQSFAALNFEPIRAEAAQVMSSPDSNSNLGALYSSATNKINLPAAGTYTPNPGTYYVSEVLFDDNDVVIHVPNASDEVFIVTDKLELGNVTTTGLGTVRFYVREGSSKFSFPDDNNRIIGNLSAPHLFIVYVDTITSTTTLDVKNGTKIFGSFMFANASINILNGASIEGYLMTEGSNVNLSNSADATVALYYVPKGTVYISQTGKINGAIIAKNVQLENNAEVYYEPAFLDNFPFDVESPIVSSTPSDGIRTLTFNIHRTTEQ